MPSYVRFLCAEIPPPNRSRSDPHVYIIAETAGHPRFYMCRFDLACSHVRFLCVQKARLGTSILHITHCFWDCCGK
jgi:hypothetical protein